MRDSAHTPSESDLVAADRAQAQAYAMMRRLMQSDAPKINGADLDEWTMRFVVAAHATGWALAAVNSARSSCEG